MLPPRLLTARLEGTSHNLIGDFESRIRGKVHIDPVRAVYVNDTVFGGDLAPLVIDLLVHA